MTETEILRILCVDDERLILRALRRVFAADRLELLQALSAAEALEILRASPPVQVVLSDYRMPGMNGIELLGQVAREWPDTVGILLSGFADLPAANLALINNHLFRLLPKPWDETALRRAVHEAAALARSRAAAGKNED